MRRSILSLVAVALVQVLLASAASSTPQINHEAAIFHPAVASIDPCVVHDVRIDIVDIVTPSDPPPLAFNVATLNTCTGQLLSFISVIGEWPTLDDSEFSVLPGYSGADLTATVSGFDSVDQSEAPTTFDLHWTSPDNRAGGLAAVTGTISRGGLLIVLDESITWNRWGSESLPWAGLWFCVFNPRTGAPGCLGQTSQGGELLHS